MLPCQPYLKISSTHLNHLYLPSNHFIPRYNSFEDTNRYNSFVPRLKYLKIGIYPYENSISIPYGKVTESLRTC